MYYSLKFATYTRTIWLMGLCLVFGFIGVNSWSPVETENTNNVQYISDVDASDIAIGTDSQKRLQMNLDRDSKLFHERNTDTRLRNAIRKRRSVDDGQSCVKVCTHCRKVASLQMSALCKKHCSKGEGAGWMYCYTLYLVAKEAERMRLRRTLTNYSW